MDTMFIEDIQIPNPHDEIDPVYGWNIKQSDRTVPASLIAALSALVRLGKNS